MANLDDIDKRTKVGSAAWKKKHDKETQQLSAWRRLHALLPHGDVTKLAKPTDPPEKLAALTTEIEKQMKAHQ